MSKKALLDFDPLRRRKIIYHEQDGKTFIETRQDAQPMVEAAKLLADTPPDPDTGFRFVCFIDDATFNRACTEGWLHDKDAWRRWAKDRDNRALNGGRENPF